LAKKAKTWYFGKITAFTAFDENHGFRDYLLSLLIKRSTCLVKPSNEWLEDVVM